MKKQFILSMLLLCFGYLQAQVVSGSKLTFNYDASGNQMLRDVSNAARSTTNETEETATLTVDLDTVTKEVLENAFMVSPNPTTGEAVLQWRPEITRHITGIELVSLVTSERSPIRQTRGHLVPVDLSGKPSGLYLVIFHLNTGKIATIQKKIIKL